MNISHVRLSFSVELWNIHRCKLYKNFNESLSKGKSIYYPSSTYQSKSVSYLVQGPPLFPFVHSYQKYWINQIIKSNNQTFHFYIQDNFYQWRYLMESSIRRCITYAKVWITIGYYSSMGIALHWHEASTSIVHAW